MNFLPENPQWDITGSTGTSGSGAVTAVAAGVSGTGFTGGGATGNTTSPANNWKPDLQCDGPDGAAGRFCDGDGGGSLFLL